MSINFYLTMRLTVLCLCFIVNGLHALIEETNNENDDDSVVIERAVLPTVDRTRRQIFFRSPVAPLHNPFYAPQGWSSVNPYALNLATTGSCFTAKGLPGKCTSFRNCYPYFKIPEFGDYESWVLGMYDTCNYYTTQGKQMFGVCCTNLNPSRPADSPTTTQDPLVEPADPIVVSNPILTNESFRNPFYPFINNWPPPLPTHPADHTIPPLPTHPPSSTYPPPTAWPPTSKPVKPVTTSRPVKPVTDKPTTNAPSVVVSASCGAKNGFPDQERIVGGHDADVHEWPWVAAIFNGGRQFCGGSLIDNMHILSAAHCVAHMSSWDVARLTVRLGDHNIKINSEARHIEKRVKRVVRHRGFDSRTLYNDIAILTLDSPVDFTKHVRPLCLPTGSSDFSGQTATVIGWGSLRESGPQPAVLQEVNILIWSNRECAQKYGGAAPGGIVEHMVCAGQANKDSCSGDSGGPLMVNNGKWTQVGIVSWGIGCGKGQYPGVYTRVEKFLPWIKKNLK